MPVYLLRFILLILSLLLISCSNQIPPKPNNSPLCHAVYDAGSSGTRLYLYQNKNGQWIEHAGAKVSALADPIRGNRGKSFNDVDAVITEIVSALDAIRYDGKLDKKGQAKWPAFDWKNQCQLASVQVLATAGMRIAEYENRQGSYVLWQRLKQKLQEKVGAGVQIKVHTLSGFEEGLFAWLAVKENKQQSNFGIAEMGGASAQITFPCKHCNNDSNAVRSVLIDGKLQKMYSYSYLGLGQDEAAKVMGIPSFCGYGAAKQHTHWNIKSCHDQINIANAQGIRDPYNFRANLRNAYQPIPAEQTKIDTWVLTGAFNHQNAKDIDNCCLNTRQCYKAKTACFRTIYLDKYLNLMAIPTTSERQKTNWTLGAVICAANNCLAQAKTPPICRWSKQGCLQ